MPRPDASQKLAASKPKDGPSKGLIASIVAVVLVIGVVAAVFVNQAGKSSTYSGGAPKGGTSDAKGLVAYPNVTLKPGAPTVDLYEDFQCPICNDLEKANGEQIMAKAKSGDIKLVWHLMTFLQDNLQNAPASAIAANGLYCAADAGKTAEYHAANFAGQPAKEGAGYSVADIKKFGKEAGISGGALDTFNKCVDDNKYKDYVAKTAENAGKDGVTGTPTIKFNGKAVSNSSPEYTQLLQQPGSFDAVLKKETGK
ncbi:thioredoxin domain-containing protein [Flexivirga sp. ID2601S]|uniref:Thioredoxin domain-containing protein n=1 Tax=Flexivirga aerilata TaxID=1656889 RepID=A0A849AM22_9MICO|nr:thioredoxin domain-containing protein [Flexivirga aerilata]NNG40358.1 thioredoxin domain-containing protein [Flexivirga aerilata]